MPFIEDFSVYTSEDSGGTTALINASTVDGTFDNEYVETSFNGVPVAGEHPVFGCAVADLPEYEFGTLIVIEGVQYKIRNWQPDSKGWINLILEKQ